MEKIEIPIINDQKLKELYQILKPIVTIDEMKYLLKEYTLRELKYQSYIWRKEDDIREKITLNKLEPIKDFLCFHTYGYYGLFKPSIAEILAQTPEEVIEKANTFEIIEGPKTHTDVFKYKEVVDKGFHLSKVRAYKLHK